ncbi:Uma2 family endonuclease [Faecalicatena sp. AGMB00832]|uniref:Uma2 family endonuclease n=1 Tax=Faecalicatena faecalis TaxID=2726362 RepID=A0ABS6D8K0_9FIRM|nr:MULTISPECIES: Uma2 family endonuclease [Faecalicatena]MBU3877778.1 Uma2 family endonuclease [Faecalicatena faecalis]MCI6465559.1 Uma2 family endonuclease [Faecalicatena sp.]MDY5617391.1 Uma2 family endonuclease [Lachnospiraceae bacterium]
MTIQEMKERKRELGYTYAQIADLSGVPLGTVQKIFNGSTASPRYDTLRALEQILREPSETLIREASTPYLAKEQGKYTLEDYYKIPDDTRMELIDGVLYDMTAPTSSHQLITGFIYAQLFNHVTDNKGPCLPMISPVDVQLDCDDKTMVEPDILVVCDRSKVIDRCVYGTPDFIIEVLSKSTKKKDAVIKLNKYMNAGVREYWMIDPMKEKVIVYDFEHDDYPVLYGFDANVPVQIWDGKCVIDFQELYEHIRFLYEKS